MLVTFSKNWKFAHRGIEIEAFKAGETKNVTEECGKQALADRVAMLAEAKKKPQDGESLPAGAEKPASSLPPAPAPVKKTPTMSAKKQK